MELAILFMLALFGLIAWAPEEVMKALLALAWLGAALFAVIPMVQLLWRAVS